MAYNLQSLITILQQILNPEESRWIVDENKPQLESLLQKAETLQQILEKSSLTKIDSLESQIRDAAYKAEDIIEIRMVQHMLSTPQGLRFTFFTPNVEQVMQQLDSATEQVVKLVKGKTMLTGSSSSSGASSSHDLTPDVESLKLVEVEGKKKRTCGPLSSSKKDLVGVESDLMQLKDRLTNMERKREIVPITGMGGIGKTTLARNLYDDPLILSRFDYRGWATISQDYNMRAILLSLLRCIIGKECDQHIEKGNDELQVILYRSLYGRRYMIMLDDIWSTKIWDAIRMYFPDNSNGSRIVITTRESGVAKYVAGSSSLHHEVQLLGKYESWKLLRQIVFGGVEEDCPDHVLQEIGTMIAGDCGGLPLAINVIGGLLSKIERSKHAWEKIEKDVIAAIAESDEQCSSILSLSYNNLPNHLKPCLLYMAAFPEDYEIRGGRLVGMWVAEGFVRSNNGNKSSEEEAEDCLKGLVERNLLLVREYKYGKPKTYNMHDLLRDLCIRKCDEKKFLHVKNGAFSNLRRVSVDTSDGMKNVNASAESMSVTRSFIGIGVSYNKIPSVAFSALRLVRVLDIMDMMMPKFPKEIFELLNLRFLAVNCLSSIPRGISRLWNLQILIAYAVGFDDASEIWELPELRYLNAKLKLGDVEEMINNVKKKKLLKLQMIRWVVVYGSVIMRDFFKSIPNIKKLEIYNKTSMEIDLSHLHKLEIINYTCDYLPKVRFPCNIRKLVLENCLINGGVLMTLCGLHKLEVLEIRRCRFEREEETCDGDDFEREEETSCYEDRELAADGDESESEEEETSYDQEWVLADGDEFPSLHFLCLDELYLRRWIADETNFPALRHLDIKDCEELEEIPSGIGEIPTLQLIHLEYCSQSAEVSARQIVEEQKSEYDNYDLKLTIILRDT